jgi:hypothetical protein
MTAQQMRIDQAGLAPGIPGVARTDGKADGSLVTLTNTGEGATTLFRLLWTPPGDVDSLDSLSATEDPKVWTFSPTAERYGTYEVELVENAGLTSEKTERRAFVVRTPYLGLVIPACNERGDKSGSLVNPGDASIVDNNAEDDPDADLAALNWAGWWRQQHALITAVDALFAPVRTTHYHTNGGGAVIRKAYASMGEAFAASYPSSFPSTVVYDIQPTVLDPDEGPYNLDNVVSYVLRAVAGRGSVELPELNAQSVVTIEDCRIVFGLTSTSVLTLRGCSTTGAPVSCDMLEAYDSTIGNDGPVTVSGIAATFDRCQVFGALTSTFDNGVDTPSLTLTNCTFSSELNITFTGALPGVVNMDARTKYLFDAASGNLTNGTITVEAPP